MKKNNLLKYILLINILLHTNYGFTQENKPIIPDKPNIQINKTSSDHIKSQMFNRNNNKNDDIISLEDLRKKHKFKKYRYKPKPIEKRIRAIKKQATKIYDIALQVNFVTHIELQDDDSILNYSIGNKEFINIKTRKNTVILTPMVKGLDTNIIINTKNKKKYIFDIKSYGKNENNANIIYYLKIY